MNDPKHHRRGPVADLSPEEQAALRKKRREQRKSGRSIRTRITAHPRHESMPLLFAQERLWALDQLDPGQINYNLSTVFRLTGDLDREALRVAIEAVIHRHESLRTRFVVDNHKAYQVIVQPSPLELDFHDLAESPRETRRALARRLANDLTGKPFDLQQGPLLRVSLLQIDAQEYWLVLATHHIVSDGWSDSVFFREMAAVYNATLKGEKAELPTLLIQYADYSLWQREYFAGARLEREVAFWQQRLEGCPDLALPLDRSRPKQRGYVGRTVEFLLDAQTAHRLQTLSRQQRVTPFMTLLAVFQVLLYRLSGQLDFCVGSPIANRDQTETEGLIGFLIDMLALRADLSDHPNFRELLDRVRANSLDAFDHKQLPFARILEVLSPPRHLNSTPIFQVVFAYQNVPGIDSHGLDGLTAEIVPPDQPAANYDLTLTFSERQNGLSGAITYDTEIFHEETVQCFARYYQSLLADALNEPLKAVSDLALVDGFEERHLVATWNRQVPSTRGLLHHWFEEQAARSPHAVAVTCTDEATSAFHGSLSYDMLNRRANQLAHALIKHGVAPNVRIALCMDRTADLVVAILGVLKAGAAYVPLDPTIPRDRLAFILEDSGASWLLTQAHLRGLAVSAAGCGVLVVDDDLLAGEASHNPGVPLPSNHLAYIIYTSGSTGRPKGVLNTHENATRLFTTNQDRFQFSVDDRWTLFHSYGFDFSVWELWGALLYGGGLVVVPYDITRSPRDFHQLLVREGITILNLTPSAFRQLVQYEIDANPSGDLQLRYIIFGGEALELSLLRPWIERYGDRRPVLVNMYGITETTVHTTYRVITSKDVESGLGSVIGSPNPDTPLYLLDSCLHPVPAGVPGEIYVGGPGLAWGYWGQPALTAERFLPNPYAITPGERMYKSGDLARCLANGEMVYLGRGDHQVKIRGFRIELGEIEAALGRHVGIREAVVRTRPDATSQPRLVAYLVATSAAPTSSALRDYLLEKLPDYMVPAHFVFLDAIPLTSNVKTDERALRTLALPREPPLAEEQATSRSTQEALLAAVWSEVLYLEHVGVHENFFELGGDSILAIQIAHRLHQAGLSINPKHLFEHQTIAELARVASTFASRPSPDSAAVSTDQRSDIAHAAEVEIRPLTPIQHWFFEVHAANVPDHWNQAVLLRVDPAVSRRLLERALRHLFQFHDAFHNCFPADGNTGERVNRICNAAVPVIHEDLRDIPEADRLEALGKSTATHQTVLNIQEGPLARAVIFELGDCLGDRLLIVIHHLVIDIFSWQILLEDLQRLYVQFSQGVESPTLPRTTAVSDWASRLASAAKGGALEEDFAYWTRLSAHETSPIPKDFDKPDNVNRDRASIDISLSKEQTAALHREALKPYGNRTHEIIIAALAETFVEWHAHPKIWLDVEGHGRDIDLPDTDLSRSVGWFTTLYPVCLELDTVSGKGDLLKAVKEQLRAVPHSGAGFGILKYLNADASTRSGLTALPAPEVVFNYLGRFDQLSDKVTFFTPASEDIGPTLAAQAQRPHLIAVEGGIYEDQLTVSWFFSTSIHRPETIQNLARIFQRNLIALIDHCLSPGVGGYTPSDFPLANLDQRTIDRMLGGQRDIEDVYPLSPMQEGILFHSRYHRGFGFYFEQFTYQFHKSVDERAMEAAWRFVHEQHPIFRTSFLWQETSHPLQCVHKERPFSMQRHNLRGLQPSEAEKALQTLLAEDTRRDFALDQAPLSRVAWVELPNDRKVMIWSHHHIILDGWSVQLVLAELMRAYQAFHAGTQPVRKAPRSFRTYIAWLYKRQHATKNARQFWSDYLKRFDTPTLLTNGADQQNVQQDATDHGSMTFSVPATTVDNLQALARRHHLTLNTFVQGAWALLLGRYLSRDDVCFGVITAGRPAELSEVESMVGPFINTLPLRIKIDGEALLMPWLQKIQENFNTLREYDASPLAEVQGFSALPGGTVLFDSLLGFQNYPVDSTIREVSASLGMEEIHSFEHTNYPLSLEVSHQHTLDIEVLFHHSRVKEAWLESVLADLGDIFQSMAAAPESHVSQFSRLSAHRRREVLAMSQGESFSYPECCLHQLFEQQVLKTPEALAIYCEGQTLTYAELNGRANQLAHQLRELGVGPESMVLVFMERSLELAIAMLGVMKAGGVYVPVDQELPQERIRYMIEDSEASLLLAQSHLASQLADTARQVVVVDAAAASSYPTSNPVNLNVPDNSAWVMYTSGSTGKPKGVVNCHRGSVNRLAWGLRQFQPQPDERILVKASHTFDITIWEYFWPLQSGLPVILARPEGHKDPEYLSQLIAEQGVTALHFVPSMLKAFLASTHLGKDCSLRNIFCGGEVLEPGVVNEFHSRFNAQVNNLYGPTETSIEVSFYPCDRHVDGPIPIGKPIGNVQIYILDQLLEPVAVGITGLVYIAGPCLASGYYRRPGLTAERFVPNPFATAPGQRMYFTGDLARLLPDGNIEFRGRVDYQIKLRGQRIELGEIEAALNEHPSITNSVVLLREDRPGHPQLTAYVELPRQTNSGADAVATTQHIAEWGELFDLNYGDSNTQFAPRFHIGGWHSSYTDQSIPADEMHTWVDGTVERIEALKPGRLLELGCGTGLLLYRLAPTCELYVGTDISSVAIQSIRDFSSRDPELAHVRAYQQSAADRAHIQDGAFDVVVLNSVCQYFPDIDYLLNILQLAIKALKPGGKIFLGDLRNLSLLRPFHASVAFAHATPETTRETLQRIVERDMSRERELLIAPDFFRAVGHAFDAIKGVRILPKKADDSNEMTRYRYDVVLYLDESEIESAAQAKQIECPSQGMTSSEIRRVLEETRGPVRITGIADSKIADDLLVASWLADDAAAPDETVADFCQQRHSQPPVCTRSALWALESDLSGHFELQLSQSENASTIDVVYHPSLIPMAVELSTPRPWQTYANHPLRAQSEHVFCAQLLDYLRACLPLYMVPSTIVCLDALPLLTSGKVDRKALPKPEQMVGFSSELDAHQNQVTELLAEIWSEVLDLPKIGPHDNFFELGGHSLLATQVVSRIRETLQLEVPLRFMFEATSVVAMAKKIEELSRQRQGISVPPLEPTSRAAATPLSFAQQRLWFLNQMSPDDTSYTVFSGLRIEGPLNVDALRQSLGRLIQRHEALRTNFSSQDGLPFQIVRPTSDWELRIVDLLDSAPEQIEEEALRLCKAEIGCHFDLEQAPLFRSLLVRLAPETHALCLSMHHIISDGWSLGILMRELAALYTAYSQGAPLSLEEPKFQYADFALWQRKWLPQQIEPQLKYWSTKLADASPTQLPSSRPPNGSRRHTGASHSFEIHAAVKENLHAISKEHRATLFMTLLAAFKILLQRYAGQNDISIGTPIANRTYSELENIVGFFVNTLVLRSDLNGDPTFPELLARVRQTTLEAYTHQDLPFEHLVEELQPVRDLDRTPFFQVTFALQTERRQDWSLGELALTPLALDAESLPFALSLTLRERPDGLTGSFEYSTDLFEAQTVERMAAHYCNLLEAISTRPKRPISQLSMLDQQERQSLVILGQGSQAAKPEFPSVVSSFEKRAQETPQAVALRHGDMVWSYAELQAHLTRCTKQLVKLGASRGAPVGVYMEPGVKRVALTLAILKLGGVFLPLDHAHPPQRIRLMIEDSRAGLILYDQNLPVEAVPQTAKSYCVSSTHLQIAEADDEPYVVPISEHTPAFLIYTSGSTGQPKAVALSHGNISHFIANAQTAYGFEPTDRMVSLASHGFDAYILEMLCPLAIGAQAEIVAREDVINPDYLAALVNRITMVHATPSLMDVIADQVLEPDHHQVRQVMVGGDMVSPQLIRKLRSSFPHATIHVVYGPSEATCISTSYPVPTEEVPNRLLIGRPLGHVAVRVLDVSGQPAPVGMAGELYIAGVGVALGYWRQTTLTDERFVVIDGERFYRSGDRVRWLPDGNLEFLGRMDSQVKLRGIRIEPGEIQARLEDLAGVSAATVCMVTSPSRTQHLAAYFVADQDHQVSVETLRRQLREQLPESMVPTYFVRLDAIPLTVNGKVNRSALPAPEPAIVKAMTTPRSPAEDAIAAIYEDVLGLERIDGHPDFFELGGHSLLATQVISRINQTFAINLSVRAIFEAPTIAALAYRADQEARQASGFIMPPPRSESASLEAPLSFAQQRLWFLDQLQPGAAAYNMPFVLRLDGQLDVKALQAAFDAISQRHGILRTVFRTQDGEPIQVVIPDLSPPLQVVNLANSHPTSALEEALLQAASAPFELDRGPLLRLHLWQVDKTTHILLVNMHHIISDGWSSGIMARELSILYAAYKDGSPNPLSKLPIQYRDFATWQRQCLTGPILEKLCAYWRRQLSDVPPLDLPTDYPRPSVQTFTGAKVPFKLEAEDVSGLRLIGRRERVTLFMTLLAAFQVLLQRYSRQNDFCIGTPVAGRTHPELESLIGFFVNMLPLRIRSHGNQAFKELLANVREQALDAFTHADLPFENIVESLKIDRDRSRSPVFQVIFALDNVPGEGFNLPGLRMSTVDTPRVASKYDLSLLLYEEDDQVAGCFEYNPDLFEEATMRGMAAAYGELLRAVIQKPDATISHLSLLDASNRQTQLQDWNATHHTFANAKPIPSLIEEQTIRTPQAIAVSFEEQHLTYQELNAAANRVANYLVDLGIRVEDRIGVLMQRAPEMVIALLGIMKAGGAYVPLDPELPQTRVATQIQQAGIRNIIIQSQMLYRLGSLDVVCHVLDTERSIFVNSPATPPNVTVSANHLIYVMFTSGTTGGPKGVANTHGGLTNRLLWMQQAYPIGATDAVLQKTPFGFDVSAWEFFWPLLTGARLVLARPGGHRDPEYLARLIDAAGITTIHFVPSMLDAFLNVVDKNDCSSLRRIICSGETLTRSLSNRCFQKIKCELHNLYGPTEAAIDVTAHRCRPDASGIVPIGTPIANTAIYILDACLMPVPVGVPGELYIGGAGLARGYEGRPGLTAEHFIPNPFGDQSGTRLYRTGDLARFRDHGTIEFLGRIDHQIKLRGQRVELEEIEATLNLHPCVTASAVTTAVAATPEDVRLVAYVKSTEAQADLPRHLRQFLIERLPAYMVPTSYHLIEALPVTANGKLDRQALPRISSALVSVAKPVAPRTRTEWQLTQLWQDLLNIDQLGIRDDFFDLGGHSLLAVKLVASIRQTLGKHLSLDSLFGEATIERQAQLLDHQDDLNHCLAAVHADGTNPRLFCVHPVGGSVICYRELAHRLGPNQPFYGLQAPHLENAAEAFTSISEMAKHYVAAIRQAQSEGPYHLAGWSFGGLVAYEIAAQLQADGQCIAWLALFDTIAPGNMPETQYDDYQLLALFAKDAGWPVTEHELRAMGRDGALAHLTGLGNATGDLPEEMGTSFLEQRLKVFQANSQAERSYLPKPIPVTIHLIRAIQPEHEWAASLLEQDPYLGWRPFTDQEIHLYTASGRHLELMQKPAVDDVARILSNLLNPS